MPEVTVLMSVARGGPPLREAIEGILGQTYRDFEMVVVDDASSDDTSVILSEYAERDPRIRVLRGDANIGLGASLAKGANAAVGRWIVRQDGDDVSEPGRIEAQVGYLRAHPDCAAVACDLTRIGPEGGAAGMDRRSRFNSVLPWALHFHYPLGCGGHLAMPAETIRRVGGYDPGRRIVDDYDLVLRLMVAGPIHILPGCLYRYRRGSPGQLTKVHFEAIDRASHRLSSITLGRLAGRQISEDEMRDLRCFWRGIGNRRSPWDAVRLAWIEGVLRDARGAFAACGLPGVGAPMLAAVDRAIARCWALALDNRGVAASRRSTARAMRLALRWNTASAIAALCRLGIVGDRRRLRDVVRDRNARIRNLETRLAKKSLEGFASGGGRRRFGRWFRRAVSVCESIRDVVRRRLKS